MAESNGQEKTEQPTSKRRKDARKKGNVLQSKDVSTVVMLLGAFLIIKIMLPSIYKTSREFMEWTIEGIGTDSFNSILSQMFTKIVWALMSSVMPVLLFVVVLGILIHGIQTRFLVSFYSLRPKLSKLNPISGIKKMFSLKNVVELIKNLVKITLLVVLLFNIVKGDLIQVGRMADMEVLTSAVYMLNMIFQLVLKVCLAFVVVAFFDFLYQRWQYEKDLKMTKQEVKDEYKQTEGNPEIKGRIRKVQRQMAMSRMMQKVPDADVIIRNPTHFAVAIQYDPDRHSAPVVVAKGQDDLALRIVRVGEENGVFITENKPLARALYSSSELNREIPAEFYGAIAEILVYIYKANNREDKLR
ncbi:flagellar biosynthesis protein FlhB [Hungatella hathewayi]|uniref:flagellar biosynthesis protein FlhB n=1 Tax=Hungatella hathewayi TaxID=154046 RepID=UPI003566B136